MVFLPIASEVQALPVLHMYMYMYVHVYMYTYIVIKLNSYIYSIQGPMYPGLVSPSPMCLVRSMRA